MISPGPLERVMNPLLRRMYPQALHRILDNQGISRLKQIVRSRGVRWQVRVRGVPVGLSKRLE